MVLVKYVLGLLGVLVHDSRVGIERPVFQAGVHLPGFEPHTAYADLRMGTGSLLLAACGA